MNEEVMCKNCELFVDECCLTCDPDDPNTMFCPDPDTPRICDWYEPCDSGTTEQ